MGATRGGPTGAVADAAARSTAPRSTPAPSEGAPGPRGVRTPRWHLRSPLAAGGLAGLQAAAAGLGVAVLPALLAWLAAHGPASAPVDGAAGGGLGAGAPAPLRAGAAAWLLGHGSGVRVAGAEVDVVPLGLTALAVLFCALAARRASSALHAVARRPPAGTAPAVAAGAVLAYTAVATGVVALTASPAVVVAVLPAVLDQIGLGTAGQVAALVLRWVLLVAFMMVALAVLYRYAPDRDAPKFRWVGLGAAVATLLWVVASAGLSIYVSNFGSYGKTYGALAGVIVLLLWLYITAFIVLLGAEINSESEQQTAKDSTEGPEQPMGERQAVKADSVAG